MKKTFLFLFIAPLLFTNCSDDDDAVAVVSTTYTLNEFADSGVSGTAIFTKVDDTSTRIDVVLTGTPAAGDHPMHIHINDVATGGGIAVTLTNVNGDTGLSTTMVMDLDNEDPITYEGLIAYNSL